MKVINKNTNMITRRKTIDTIMKVINWKKKITIDMIMRTHTSMRNAINMKMRT